MKPDPATADLQLFDGLFHLDLDERGRLALPVPWRHPFLGSEQGLMMIHRDEEPGFLRAFATADFERRLSALLEGRPFADLRNTQLRMYLGRNADRCALDRHWRLELGEIACFRNLFDGEVTLIGRGPFFELRRTDRYWEGLSHFEGDHPFYDLI